MCVQKLAKVMRDVVKIATPYQSKGAWGTAEGKDASTVASQGERKIFGYRSRMKTRKKGRSGGPAMLGHSVRSNCQNTNALEHGAHTCTLTLSHTHAHTGSHTKVYIYI